MIISGSLGFPNEQRGGDIYFCEPSPGLGVAVWYTPQIGCIKPHYFIAAFPVGGPSLERAWLDTYTAPAGVPRGRSLPVDDLGVVRTIREYADNYEKEQAYERSLAA